MDFSWALDGLNSLHMHDLANQMLESRYSVLMSTATVISVYNICLLRRRYVDSSLTKKVCRFLPPEAIPLKPFIQF